WTHLRRRLVGGELLAYFRRNAVFAGGRSLSCHGSAPLNHIGIVHAASSARTPLTLAESTAAKCACGASASATATTTAPAPTPTPNPAKPAAADLQQRRLIEVDGQFLVITVGDRTLTVGEGGVHNRAARLQGARILNRNAFRNAEINRDRGVAADGDKQTAPLDELLQVGYADDTHTAAHVSDRVGRLSHIRRHVRFLPRNGRFGVAAFGDAPHQCLRRAADWTPDDHVPFVAQVGRVANNMIRNVIVWNAQSVELDAIPALVLRVRPGVNQR